MQAQQSLKFPRVPLLRYDPGDLRTACRQRDGMYGPFPDGKDFLTWYR